MIPMHIVDHYTLEDIYNAWLDCRIHKRYSTTALQFEYDLDANIYRLYKEINNDTYEISPSVCFAVTRPKPREIWAAQYKDRIVHHLLYNGIAPRVEATFIYDTYSCIKDRGTLAASERMAHFARSLTNNWQHDGYCLKMDIANYFVSICKPILWDILVKFIGTGSLTSKLWHKIVFNNPTINPIIRHVDELDAVPIHKSILRSPDIDKENYALPIGNLTSQFLSGLYLDGLDKYCKHTLGIRYYARYVDDICILGETVEELRKWKDAICKWIQVNRQLKMHPDKIHITPISHGIDFVGRKIYPFHISSRESTIQSSKEAVKELQAHPCTHTYQSVQSYLGLLKQSDTFDIRKSLCDASLIPEVIGCSEDYGKLINLGV